MVFRVMSATNGYIIKYKQEGLAGMMKEPDQIVCKDKKEVLKQIERMI